MISLISFLIILSTFLNLIEAKTHVLLVSTVECDHKCSLNYGAEADIFRAYHLLLRRGFSEDQIILMTPDDFSRTSKLPWGGKLYDNENKDVDLREGVRIDYSGKVIFRENILAVMLGDKQRVRGGNGRVIESTPEDNIFIFWAGHGDFGALMLPNGFRLTSLDINLMIEALHKKGHYKNMVLYLFACMSGSLFSELDPNLNTLVMTSAQNNEYSDGLKKVDMPDASQVGGSISFSTEFGNAWFEALEQADESETIAQQFERIRKNSLIKTHPPEFGNQEIKQHRISEYFGSKKRRFSSSTFDSFANRNEDFRSQYNFNGNLNKVNLLEKERIQQKAQNVLSDLRNQHEIHSSQSGSSHQIRNHQCHHELTNAIVLKCPSINKSKFYNDFFIPVSALCEQNVDSHLIIHAIVQHC